MRRFFAVIFAAFFTLLFCGCSKKPFSSDAEICARQKILLVGNSADPASLDPSIATGLSESKIIAALFEGLVSPDESTLQIKPAQAESWTISPDGKTYVFKIRKTAYWSNGDKVKAGDFVYAWRRILNPKLGAEYAGMLYVIKNARDINKGKKEPSMLGAKALDDSTLLVELERPRNDFLNFLYHTSYMPLNQKNLEAFNAYASRRSKWTRPENMVVNGAFKLARYEINSQVQVEKNPTYWDAKNININGIRFLPITNMNTEDRAFFAGQLHLTDSVSAIRLEKENKKASGYMQKGDWYATYYYVFNTKRPPFDNPLVRRAFSLAVNRTPIIDSCMKGGQSPAYSLVPDLNVNDKARAENIELAKELLAKAGYPNGKGFPKIRLVYNTSQQHKPIAESLQECLRKNLGVFVELYNLSWPAYLDARSKGDFDMTRASWTADYLSPESFLSNFLSDSPLNNSGWKNSEFDRAVFEQRYKDAQKIMDDNAVVLPLFYYKRIFLKSPLLKGWSTNKLDYHNYKSAHF